MGGVKMEQNYMVSWVDLYGKDQWRILTHEEVRDLICRESDCEFHIFNMSDEINSIYL